MENGLDISAESPPLTMRGRKCRGSLLQPYLLSLNHWEGTKAWTWADFACAGLFKEEHGPGCSTWLEVGARCIL